jgi:glycerol-3-phosphate dehydrogenase
MLSSKIAPWLGVLGLGAGGGILLQGNNPGEGTEVTLSAEIPTRQQQVARLAASKPYKKQQNPFDVLIIGGGATGAGIAVDAATRWACCMCCARNSQLARLCSDRAHTQLNPALATAATA